MFSSSSIDTYEENILHWFSLHEYALMLNEVNKALVNKQQQIVKIFVQINSYFDDWTFPLNSQIFGPVKQRLQMSRELKQRSIKGWRLMKEEVL